MKIKNFESYQILWNHVIYGFYFCTLIFGKSKNKGLGSREKERSLWYYDETFGCVK